MSLGLNPLNALLHEILSFLSEHSSGRPRHYSPKPTLANSHHAVFDAWLASRAISRSRTEYLAPGAPRQFSQINIELAYNISQQCAPRVFSTIWQLHPFRILVMIAVDLLRGVFPAFRGYSQALIINELQSLFSSGAFTWTRLSRLLLTELCRVALEGLTDSFATNNENIIQSSARFAMEYKQMEQRVRMDVPTLADPIVRDLFHESDLFVRSFSGTASFGLLSPFEFIRTVTLVSELISHTLILWSLICGGTELWPLILTVASSAVPLLMSWFGDKRLYYEEYRSPQEARTAAKQEKMRALAHSDPFRPEIILFGLGPWILQSWARARKAMLGLERPPSSIELDLSSSLLTHVNVAGLVAALQQIPLVLVLQSSTPSLGSFALYRTSIQCIVFTARNLLSNLRMAFQGVFLMGAFCAAMEVEPLLQPKEGTAVRYRSPRSGMKIEARNLSFSYPGNTEPTLKNISFTLEAGECLAIVGYNGSGKSTLANVLLRIMDYDGGELLVNGQNIRRYHPAEYHEHVTAVFQGFSKFSASAKENIGVGYFPDMRSSPAVEKAAYLAGAGQFICSLPKGLQTTLDASGYDQACHPSDNGSSRSYGARECHGLSGGEWQRIAVSRAFMRAHRPDVQLLILDEPTSSLDAHAQNRVFDNVDKMSRSSSGERTKTVIFITHRLSTARRADKIAMMEQGTIIEFGTHQELLDRKGSYASLYRASV